jgi:hypothetical protein
LPFNRRFGRVGDTDGGLDLTFGKASVLARVISLVSGGTVRMLIVSPPIKLLQKLPAPPDGTCFKPRRPILCAVVPRWNHGAACLGIGKSTSGLLVWKSTLAEVGIDGTREGPSTGAAKEPVALNRGLAGSISGSSREPVKDDHPTLAVPLSPNIPYGTSFEPPLRCDILMMTTG